jgi:hypothetical protein
VTRAIECCMDGSVVKGKVEGAPRDRHSLVIFERFSYIMLV